MPDAEGQPVDTAGAASCLDRFMERYNARDMAGVDDCLHFPHLVLNTDSYIVLEHAGSHSPNYFERLDAEGWQRTAWTKRDPVLATDEKVHFLVNYARENRAGERYAEFANVWVVGQIDGEWKITVRSH